MSQANRVCVLLAEGFEEIEAVTIIDVLRRAAVDVTVLGVDSDHAVTGAHAIPIGVDAALADRADDPWDLVVLPGGLPGAQTLTDHAGVQTLVRRQHAAGRRLAAICAAPMALGAAGVVEGRRATCYPGFQSKLRGATCVEGQVVVDGHITTSRGPGTALAFALQLVAQLQGDDAADRLAAQMLTSR